ncbi:MAG: hypothetical protein FWC50_05450 [Planctomycetaceae bacterium]|nr:hypothetical protein [Planctomycetaceae bacterium]
MFSDSTRRRKQFLRLIPMLFQKSRVVQIGEPLKVSEAQKQRRRWWFQSVRWLPRIIFLLLFGIGVTGGIVFDRWEIVPACVVFALYSMIFEFIGRENDFIPFRWIIVCDGIWLRSSKDVSQFLPWRSIVQIDADPKAGSKWHRIDLVTIEGERETLKVKDDLLPFVNKLLELLPRSIDPEPLRHLQWQLRIKFLYDALFEIRDSFLAFGMILFIPVFLLLNRFFPPAEVGFAAWGAVMGIALLICVGLFILVRRAVVRRQEQCVERLMQELDETDVTALLQVANSPRHAFGSPPRNVSVEVRRKIFFSGDLIALTLTFSLLFAFLAFLLGVALCFTDPAEVRYGLLPFRWQPTHAGVIVAIADSSTERAPNGNPAPGGRDVITLEQTLPDGRTIRCQHPSWANRGNFHVGQKVPLLRYVNDETCLQIDDPMFYFDSRSGLFAVLGFGTLFFGGGGVLVMTSYSQRKKTARLLETAPVVKYRIRKRIPKVKTILTPVRSAGETLELKSQVGIVGETVHVFLDEAKPNQSFVAESYRGELRYDAETGEIECTPDPFARYAKWSLLALALGIGVIVSRLIWVW